MEQLSGHGVVPLRRHIKKFVAGGVLIVVFSAIAVASALLIEVTDDVAIVRKASKPIPRAKEVLADVDAGAAQTILLLGSDKRFADTADMPPRSDTIILAHLDPDRNATAIMSLPRDLQVQIPGYPGMRKINEAFELGGAALSVETVTQFLGLPINHVVNVNFGGFRRAVDRLGCVYADVDRKYFNDNSAPGENYATIDIEAGYQKLCGSDALDFVRYRHGDSDFLRAARQQEFLRQAKQQIGLRAVFEDRKRLLRIFGAYTQSDIAQQDVPEILGLLKLVYEASKDPITEVRFPGTDCAQGTCVEISDEALQATVDKFIDVRDTDLGDRSGADRSPSGKPEPKRVEAPKGLAPGLVADRAEGREHVRAIGETLAARALPVYFPSARLGRGGYADSSPRSYEITDPDSDSHRAYRLVLSAGLNGEYYGVQGTTWKSPPILDSPTDERRVAGRTFMRYFDGKRLRLVAFQTPEASYWVSNTLSRQLTNSQMMGIAESLRLADG